MIAYGTAIAEALINQRFTDEQAGFLPLWSLCYGNLNNRSICDCSQPRAASCRGARIVETKKQTISGFRYLLMADDSLAEHDFYRI